MPKWTVLQRSAGSRLCTEFLGSCHVKSRAISQPFTRTVYTQVLPPVSGRRSSGERSTDKYVKFYCIGIQTKSVPFRYIWCGECHTLYTVGSKLFRNIKQLITAVSVDHWITWSVPAGPLSGRIFLIRLCTKRIGFSVYSAAFNSYFFPDALEFQRQSGNCYG